MEKTAHVSYKTLFSMQVAWVTQTQLCATRCPQQLGRQWQHGMRTLMDTSTQVQEWESTLELSSWVQLPISIWHKLIFTDVPLVSMGKNRTSQRCMEMTIWWMLGLIKADTPLHLVNNSTVKWYNKLVGLERCLCSRSDEDAQVVCTIGNNGLCTVVSHYMLLWDKKKLS